MLPHCSYSDISNYFSPRILAGPPGTRHRGEGHSPVAQEGRRRRSQSWMRAVSMSPLPSLLLEGSTSSLRGGQGGWEGARFAQRALGSPDSSQGAARPQEGGEPDPQALRLRESALTGLCSLSSLALCLGHYRSQAHVAGPTTGRPGFQSQPHTEVVAEQRGQTPRAEGPPSNSVLGRPAPPDFPVTRAPEAGRRREPGKSVLAQAALRWVSVPGREGGFCFSGATLSGVEEGGEGTGPDSGEPW